MLACALGSSHASAKQIGGDVVARILVEQEPKALSDGHCYLPFILICVFLFCFIVIVILVLVFRLFAVPDGRREIERALTWICWVLLEA